MEQYNRIWNGERDISLRGVLFAVIKRWRALVAMLLLGAVIGCGISLVKMRQGGTAAMERKLASIQKDALNEDKIRQYADYVELYEAQLRHDENALILRLDPESVWAGGEEWFLSADEDTIDEICSRFNGALWRDGAFAAILERSGLDCTETEFRELVSLSAQKVLPDQQIVGENTESRTRYAKLTISAWYSEEGVCRDMFDALAELAEKTDGELKADFSGIYESSQVSDYMTHGYSDEVRSAQVSAVRNRRELLDTVTKLKKDLSKDEKLYYSYHYEEHEAVKARFSKLWPVLGAAVLCLAGAVWFMLVYIFDGHLKDEQELGELFGLRVLGVTETEKRRCALDRWPGALEQKRGLRPVSGEYLSAYLGTMKFGKTAVCFDSGDGEQEKLARELARCDGRVVPAGDLATDSAAPALAAQSDGILLLVRAGRSAYTELRHIAELANGMQKKIIGAIVIR